MRPLLSSALTTLVLGCALQNTLATLLSIDTFGAVQNDASANVTNMQAFQRALDASRPGDTVLVPEGTYQLVGGVRGTGLINVTVQIDGTLEYLHDLDHWPIPDDSTDGKYANLLEFQDSSFVTVMSSTGAGLIDGGGKPWWNQYLIDGHDLRPKGLYFDRCSDVLVEGITILNSPSWHLRIAVVRAEISNFHVLVDRSYQHTLKHQMQLRRLRDAGRGDDAQALAEAGPTYRGPTIPGRPHMILQPEDLNTDGIDVSGADIWIHDCTIINDDDSIAVKPSSTGGSIGDTSFNCTQDMLVENMVLTGFGASIGSVGPSVARPCVDRVTLRNITMPQSGKGIYVKSNTSPCTGGVSSQLSNILFEDVLMTRTVWWAVWIGPQQQHQPHDALGGACALAYPLFDLPCPTQGCSDFRNITLRNVAAVDSLLSPGVLRGNVSNPMELVFDNVTASMSNGGPLRAWPFDGYDSSFVDGVCVNGCDPVPAGFVVQG